MNHINNAFVVEAYELISELITAVLDLGYAFRGHTVYPPAPKNG